MVDTKYKDCQHEENQVTSNWVWACAYEGWKALCPSQWWNKQIHSIIWDTVLATVYRRNTMLQDYVKEHIQDWVC